MLVLIMQQPAAAGVSVKAAVQQANLKVRCSGFKCSSAMCPDQCEGGGGRGSSSSAEASCAASP